jgi:hypothetical protein
MAPVTEQSVAPQGRHLGPRTRIHFRHEKVVEGLHCACLGQE